MSEKVRFVSPNARLRMVRRPAGEQIMPNGTVAVTVPEVVYEFDAGGLTLREGQDLIADKWDDEAGIHVEQDAVEWIRSTGEYGDRVVEVVPEAPDPSSLFVQVGVLEAGGDLAGLIALGDAEAGSWNRPLVLDQIRDAVERLSAEPATK